MIVTRTVTKKLLEYIVHETFTNFGQFSSSKLLDSLKFLGFYYATSAGISINIEDLKTPNVKKDFLQGATDEMEVVSQQWKQGFVSDTERFQTIIDSWNIATESLKNRIVDYYQYFDPANNLYIMAFSGARGNMSQVRQLVGMRGLMSDQNGKIIDLPIQTNFREGLSSIDYIISSYGARKGIVDTALKTADSGYLTRRLIYIAQDLIIREIDCKTENGVMILFTNKTNFKTIVGRSLISTKSLSNFTDSIKKTPIILTEAILEDLKKQVPLALNIRSSLTCNSNGSICQKCYGWDLAKQKLISLGEAVGILAAQSIGEPGTQLTMRTFHTGGIFTSELLQQTLAPFSGKIEIPPSLKFLNYRTNHGQNVAKLEQETKIFIRNWEGKVQEIFLEIGTFLYIRETTFIKKGQLISEYSSQSMSLKSRRLKPIYTMISGELLFRRLTLRSFRRDGKLFAKVTQNDGTLWLGSGKIFSFPLEVLSYPYLNLLKYPSFLKKTQALNSLKLTSPFQGIFRKKGEIVEILQNDKKIELNINSFFKVFRNFSGKLFIFPKNYQYIDAHSLIGILHFFPLFEGKIYAIRQKQMEDAITYFFITESDIWKIYSDQMELDSAVNSETINLGTKINSTSRVGKSGLFLKKDGFEAIYQNAIPIFLSSGTILNYTTGDFAYENQLLATLVNYTQQTEDIVQGLPKIEELIEARVPSAKCILSKRPGIILNSEMNQKYVSIKQEKNVFFWSYLRQNSFKEQRDKLKATNLLENSKDIDYETRKEIPSLKKNYFLNIVHSLGFEKDANVIFYENKMWKMTKIPKDFKPVSKRTQEKEYYFQDTHKTYAKYFQGNDPESNKKKNKKRQKKLVMYLDGVHIGWWWSKSNTHSDLKLFRKKGKTRVFWRKIQKNFQKFKNLKCEAVILQLAKNFYILLEPYHPIQTYNLPLTKKIDLKPGSFVDIGEPINEGLVDAHDMLSVLFNYHLKLDGIVNGTLKSLTKFQLLMTNSIQAIYQSQGVDISIKHIEIIIRQMTTKVKIKDGGSTPLVRDEIINLSYITSICNAMRESDNSFCFPKYEPILLSTTNSSLLKDGFLSAAGFQETKRVLTKAALEGNSDWLRGLKECVIIGRIIPAGSAFLNYKNYLDDIYFFQNKFEDNNEENNTP